MSGLPFDQKIFEKLSTWKWPAEIPHPQGSPNGTMTVPPTSGIKYFCVRCEDRNAIEGRPTAAHLIEKYGADTTIHVCFSCGYDRAVALPADLASA